LGWTNYFKPTSDLSLVGNLYLYSFKSYLDTIEWEDLRLILMFIMLVGKLISSEFDLGGFVN